MGDLLACFLAAAFGAALLGGGVVLGIYLIKKWEGWE